MLSGHGYFSKYLHRTGNTTSPSSDYEEGEVINDAENTVFECAHGQSYRFVLTSIIGTITAANIVEIMIASRENWASVANYVEHILRLKKRDLEAAEHAGVPAEMILAHVSNGIEVGTWMKGIVKTLSCLLDFRHAIRMMI